MARVDTDIRAQAIVNLRLTNPCATLQQIGTEVGLTRERVRQILSQNELETKAFKQHYLCLNCQQLLRYTSRSHSKNEKYCSRQCQYDYTHIQIACELCGKLKVYALSDVLYRLRKRCVNHFFCSHHCTGIWLGKMGKSGRPRNLERLMRKGNNG